MPRRKGSPQAFRDGRGLRTLCREAHMTRDFSARLGDRLSLTKLPDGCFKTSGTGVSTVLAVIDA